VNGFQATAARPACHRNGETLRTASRTEHLLQRISRSACGDANEALAFSATDSTHTSARKFMSRQAFSLPLLGDSMTTRRGSRKDDHVRLAMATHRQASESDVRPLDDVAFVHHSLACIDMNSVDFSSAVIGTQWSLPFFINAMTGGTPSTGRINTALAEAAAETGIAVATGSMSAFIKDPSCAQTFRVLRTANPNGYVMANINPNFSADAAMRCVDLLGADALQIHINPAQEVVMPEGDRFFNRWIENITSIAGSLNVPVIVKEVGFGLSAKTIAALGDMGVSAVDIGGSGGTNFAAIEDARRTTEPGYGFLHSWGQSTPLSLVEADQRAPEVERFASGGVRSALDVARCLALGAGAVGIAGAFLKAAVEGGAEAAVDMIQRWRDDLQRICCLLGAQSIPDLTRTDLALEGALRQSILARKLEPDAYVNRSGLFGSPRLDRNPKSAYGRRERVESDKSSGYGL
jgi:isopentenyl-diphosphate delta-isomerase